MAQSQKYPASLPTRELQVSELTKVTYVRQKTEKDSRIREGRAGKRSGIFAGFRSRLVVTIYQRRRAKLGVGIGDRTEPIIPDVDAIGHHLSP